MDLPLLVELPRALEGVHGGRTVTNSPCASFARPGIHAIGTNTDRSSPAAPEHAAELAAVLLAAWEPHRSQLSDALWEELTPPEAEVAAWLRGGFEVYRVSFESQPVGVVRVAFPTGACVLDRLAVTPEHRRRGFGEYVAEHAVNRARRVGAGRVWARVPEGIQEGVRLFRKLGFSEVAVEEGRVRPWRLVLLDRAL